MVIKIDLYSKILHLNQKFTTARSSISKKEILFLVFKVENEEQFAYELPLSPSMQAMPLDIHKEFYVLQNKDITLNQISNKYIINSISYYINLILLKKTMPVCKPSEILNFKTVSISKEPILLVEYQSLNCIPRFKGSLENLDQLIHFSKSTNQKWAVDFNASLDQINFIKFCKSVNFENCVYIEQPLPVGELNYKIKSHCQAKIFADEEMRRMSPDTYDFQLWDGFSLKPINYNYTELINWIHFAQSRKINFFIGSQINELIDQSFSSCWNLCSNWQLQLAEEKQKMYCLSSNNTLQITSHAFDYVMQTSNYISTLHLII